MIASKPDISQIGETMVVGNLLGRKVAVIVVDGLRGGILEIEFPCCFPLEEEVVGDKSFRFHGALVSVGGICGKSKL